MRAAMFLLIFMSSIHAYAQSWLCEAHSSCGEGRTGNRSSSAPAQPTTNSTISINPAAVPTEETWGLETIYYGGQFDFAIVRGLGRIGAALSPSNNEETFFGPPAFEDAFDFYERKLDGKKLPAQKYTLATAFSLYTSKRSGLKRFDLNIGAIAKYNKITQEMSGGGGLSGVAGPFTFGYAAYSDMYVQNEYQYEIDKTTRINSTAETYSLGVFLESVALDYSRQYIYALDDTAVISIFTGSLLLKKAILTASVRNEASNRPSYNFASRILESKREKNETFGGLQVVAGKHVMVGAFYNYYLLHEFSIGLTAFF